MSSIYRTADNLLINGEIIAKITLPEHHAKYLIADLFGHTDDDMEAAQNESFDAGKDEGRTAGIELTHAAAKARIEAVFDEFEPGTMTKAKMLEAIYCRVMEEIDAAKNEVE